jgi:4-hydroxybenzoate polyprenyltransferase
MKIDIDLDLTTTIIVGCWVSVIGTLMAFTALFVAPEALGPIAAIVASGCGLFAAGKTANTYYDTHIKNDTFNPEA